MSVVSCRGSKSTLDSECWLAQACRGWCQLPKMLLGLWEVRARKQRHPLSVVQCLKFVFWLEDLEVSDCTCSFYTWGNKTQQREVSFLLILTASERQNQTQSVSLLHSPVLLALCETAMLVFRLKKGLSGWTRV